MNRKDLPARALRASKRLWLRYTLKNAKPGDMAQRLEQLYKVGDPWHLQGDRERARFEATNAIIKARFPHARSILEIGSGEGHQTRYLMQVAPTVVGVEISPTAVARARVNHKQATFAVGDFRKRPWGATPERFDLVVACEVLYYLPDGEVPSVLAAMEEMGRGCLVTFFEPAARKLAHTLPDRAERSWFHHGGVTWLAAWWQSAAKR